MSVPKDNPSDSARRVRELLDSIVASCERCAVAQRHGLNEAVLAYWQVMLESVKGTMDLVADGMARRALERSE